MNKIHTIYELDPIVDNPIFEGFGFKRERSLRGTVGISYDFMPDDVEAKGRGWTVTRLAPYWTPQIVEGRVRALNDYPCVNLSFSQPAVDALREFLEPNGELLPLTSTVGQYYAYNVTTVADVMDVERAKIKWFDKKRDVAMEVRHFAFKEAKLNGLSIFRLVELPASTFVTNTFAEAVTEHSLNGFNFVKVWPFPEGVNWEREKRKKQRAPTVVRTESGEGPSKGILS
jgi:hypothetical protein